MSTSLGVESQQTVKQNRLFFSSSETSSLESTNRMTAKENNYSHEIPSFNEKAIEVDIKPLPASVLSDISHTSTLLEPSTLHPCTTLYISARGIGIVRLPVPSSEVEVQIFHNDGKLAYTSIRAKRCSGNAVLSHPKLGELISTTYRFGPNREPELKLLQNPTDLDNDASVVKVCGRWTSRATSFMTADNRVFEWTYAHTKDSRGKKVNIIALMEKGSPDAQSNAQGKLIAQLIRSDETRTEGPSKCSAGNGGHLVLDQEATSHLDEAIIVATCLMMLKKEIDRRRAMQFMLLGVVASGGGGS